MLDIDAGHGALVDGARALRVDGDGHALDVVCGNPVFFDDVQHRVDRRLDRVSDGPALDRGVHDFVFAAQPAHQLPRIGGHAVGMKKTAVAEEYVFDAGKAHRRHQRGGDAVAGRHAAEIKGFFNMFDVARPARQAGRLLRGVRQCIARLVGVQFQDGG